MLTAIVIPADERQPIRLQEIEPHDLNAYRQIVGGYLEAVTLERPAATLYLNEEGKLDGLPINPRATALAWVHSSYLRNAADVLVGPVFIVGPPDQNGDDLTAPIELVNLLFHTKALRVEVLTDRTSPWWHRTKWSFPTWLQAYRSAVSLTISRPKIQEVRVVPELDQELQATWYRLGQENPWINKAVDPPFTPDSFVGCYSIEELTERLGHGTWSVGSAFYYQDLCFINQVDGGDEWLTIRHGMAFESINALPLIERGEFASLVTRLLAASKEQCQRLKY